MAEQKQDGRRSKKGGGKKKQDQPKPPRHRSNWTLERKRANVERHLAQDAKRAGKAKEASTPRGSTRIERRRLAWLAAVEQAAKACGLERVAEVADTKQSPQPVDEGYADTPLGHQFAAMDREAERAGLFPERE